MGQTSSHKHMRADYAKPGGIGPGGPHTGGLHGGIISNSVYGSSVDYSSYNPDEINEDDSYPTINSRHSYVSSFLIMIWH